MRRNILLPLLFAIVALAVAHPAAAHHAMEGKTPANFIQGLLSGLGHPVIGIDHLAFLVAVGLAVGIAGLNPLTPLVFVAASAIGVAVHVQGLTIPAAEPAVAASVLLAGLLIARGTPVAASLWLALFALAGLFHGYAYGESIVGAETAPLWAYLCGLVIVQSLLTGAVALLARRTADPVTSRLGGAVVAGVGLAVLAARIVPV
jgi:urease accessory protein